MRKLIPERRTSVREGVPLGREKRKAPSPMTRAQTAAVRGLAWGAYPVRWVRNAEMRT